ncbi:uncharacterized protein B0H18DRAFT_1196777 [Fomitopsis serialis]|uniref:uncharacterized protein n=1 Tax=Fomitopsis serialis TaxID=139415 RepID=UPI0020084099|nr:uncharacterized protein B0H18DRAFT_1196777 [Neoantrodia serialis]KAH9933406.1 hypothetical protein B0H18DRAFT_1196777 [Neoantrodia serialis]
MSQEDQLTCRICSAPAEPDQPLFHPCKCSGSIRYIHQDCLTTWLAHSKKKTCDICKYPYSFTKVYSPDMPERLPVLLLLRQLSRQAFTTVVFCMRAVIVAVVWLALLPWATIWTWRMYFAMGDTTYVAFLPQRLRLSHRVAFIDSAWWISNRPRPLDDIAATNASSLNDTTSTAASNTTSFLSHPIVRSISSDIVSGQIIASFIVLAFVAIFLLREWISQNARPGVFEQGDIGDLAQGVVPQPPAQEQPAPLPAPAPVIPGENSHVAQEQPHRPPDDDDGEAPKKRLRRDAGAEEDEPYVRRPTPRLARDKGKRIDRRVGVSGHDRLRRRHPFRDSSESPEDEIAHNDATDEPDDSSRPPLDLHEEQARFTFRPPDQLSGRVEQTETDETNDLDPSPSSASTDISSWTPVFSQDVGDDVAPPRPRSANPDVPEDVSSLISPIDPPTPVDIYVPKDMPSPILPSVSSDVTLSDTESDVLSNAGPITAVSTSSTVSDMSGSLRRPPLPSVTLPSPSSGVPPSASASISRGATPLASPSLATYSAPEEFEAGPSNPAEYFGRSPSDEEMRTEHSRYFVTEEDEGFGAELEEDGEGTEHADDDWSEVRENGEVDMHPHEDDNGQPLQLRPDEAPAQPALNPEDARRAVDAVAEIGARLDELNQQLEAIQENLDENIEDDMDGALEAIGLRGPLHGVIQNAALMTFILDVTIGLGIWVPFTLGKSTALLSLDPPRLLYILHLPLRVIRLVTDPIVDGVALLFTRLVVPPILRLMRLPLRPLLGVESVYRMMRSVGGRIIEQLSTKPEQTATETPSSLLDRVAESDSVVFHYIEPYFAPLGNKIRLSSEEAKSTWMRLAVGSGPNEKIFAILLGYAVMGLLLALYLNVLTIGNVKNAGKAVRSAVRQQLLVVKVATFIIVELVIFPLGCGVMLDACTVWLVPQGNFRSRAAFLTYAPMTSAFYHWVIGTMFMYQFAVLLAGCRDIMRPGAMWFIKDPQDQNFHPIRDILERPALVQIRKLLLSGIMYSFVVAAVVGTVSGIMQMFSRTVLPFRWKIREPLSPVPLDLLFLHFVLPYTMQYFRPKKALRQFGIGLWKSLAARLRLSSYMFGGRYPLEEYTPRHWWQKIFSPKAVSRFVIAELRDGTFKRVPNNDTVALVKDLPAVAEVDRHENPLNDEQARIIKAQNAEAEKHKRNIKKDYTVVYLPPHIKYRVAAFIFTIWIVGSVILAFALGAPILLGRMVFKLFVPHDVHDGYAFIAGFYLLWACYLIAYSVDRMDKRRQRRGSILERRAIWPLYVLKRGVLWMAQMSYMVLFLGIVIPTLLALVMEFYLQRIRIVDMWALGLLYSKIFLRVLSMQPGNGFMHGIDQIMRGGWTHLDPFRATRDVIAPLTFGLLGMLLFPAGALWVVQKLFGLPLGDDFLFLHVYPSIFTLAGFGHTVLVGTRVLGSWSQGIRDKEFLVEMRLQNLESESSNGADAKQPDKPYKETLVAQEQMQIDDRDDAEAALGVREEEEEEED